MVKGRRKFIKRRIQQIDTHLNYVLYHIHKLCLDFKDYPKKEYLEWLGNYAEMVMNMKQLLRDFDEAV